MVSDATPVLGTVTVIDDYSGSNGSGETRVNVGAVVPDIPPDWAYPVQLPYTVPIPFPTFQGSLVTNPFPYLPPSNGLYNFVFSLTDGSNGLPASGIFTQAVSVVNGLFTTPLIFDPAVFTGGARWLNISIQPPNGGNFIPLSPPLQIAPAPQAIYAYSAGVVASLSPGQAVTSLNGLTGGVALQAANGIIIGTNGNTLVLASQAAVPSDRNIKTGFMPVSPEEILGRLAALPIQSWRFTNEAAGVRHVGPMAQDFKAAFDLGNDDKSIAFVDGQGVALAAIQGLNAKLSQKDAEIQTLKARNDSLAERLSQLEAAVKLLTEENGLNRN